MTSPRAAALQYSQQNKSVFLSSLKQLLEIPSVSTDPDHIPDMEKAAQWVASELSAMNFSKVTIFPTEKHPVVYGERMDAGPLAPIVLVYGHYDVQPADPLELWKTGPFTPEQRGENLFARGASDMKGQVVATLSALHSILAAGPLPVNVKYIVEGEEEIGSPSLGKFLRDHKDLLACSFALNPDSGMISADVPTIVYALRGLAYFELRVTGPSHDLHSGILAAWCTIRPPYWQI